MLIVKFCIMLSILLCSIVKNGEGKERFRFIIRTESPLINNVTYSSTRYLNNSYMNIPYFNFPNIVKVENSTEFLDLPNFKIPDDVNNNKIKPNDNGNENIINLNKKIVNITNEAASNKLNEISYNISPNYNRNDNSYNNYVDINLSTSGENNFYSNATVQNMERSFLISFISALKKDITKIDPNITGQGPIIIRKNDKISELVSDLNNNNYSVNSTNYSVLDIFQEIPQNKKINEENTNNIRDNVKEGIVIPERALFIQIAEPNDRPSYKINNFDNSTLTSVLQHDMVPCVNDNIELKISKITILTSENTTPNPQVQNINKQIPTQSLNKNLFNLKNINNNLNYSELQQLYSNFRLDLLKNMRKCGDNGIMNQILSYGKLQPELFITQPREDKTLSSFASPSLRTTISLANIPGNNKKQIKTSFQTDKINSDETRKELLDEHKHKGIAFIVNANGDSMEGSNVQVRAIMAENINELDKDKIKLIKMPSLKGNVPTVTEIPTKRGPDPIITTPQTQLLKMPVAMIKSYTLQSILNDLKNLDNKKVHIKSNGVWSPSAVERATPSQHYFSYYDEPECTREKDKIICRMGNFTYVINNGNQNISNDVLSKFVALMYRRSLEGDKCFDISIVNPKPKTCEFSISKTSTTTTESNHDDLTPVTIVCTPAKRPAGSADEILDTTIDPDEVIFQCRWKKLGIK